MGKQAERGEVTQLVDGGADGESEVDNSARCVFKLGTTGTMGHSLANSWQ